jgi:hypothetical protein
MAIIMVMIFQSEEAGRFLLEKGVVFTFRVKRRKKLGKDWITYKRGRRRIANVLVEEGKFKSSELSLYVEYSGFSSLQEWIGEIKRLNGGRLPAEGWLYKVTLLSIGGQISSPNT